MALFLQNAKKRIVAAQSTLSVVLGVLWLATSLLAPGKAAGGETNSFPDLNEVFQGRAFTNEFDRDVFFLRQVRERYPAYWPSLLAANVTPGNYVVDPPKLRRFVNELGAAAAGTDDAAAVASLSAVISNPDFYTNASQPEVQEAVVSSLGKIGPGGVRALADVFSQTHYRTDPERASKAVADAIGKAGISDANVDRRRWRRRLAPLTASNGGSYPRGTRTAVKNLLGLTNGAAALRPHLNTNEVFLDPGRFQPVVDGIAEARADSLTTNLEELMVGVKVKLARQSPGANPYRDDLADLQKRLAETIERLRLGGK